MPNLPSAKKRLRQNLKIRLRNRSIKSALHTQLRKFEEAVAAHNIEGAQQEYQKSARALDKTVSKGIIHKNTANRKKSRLHKKLTILAGTEAGEASE